MAYQRGDVLLVTFPFSNLSTTKARPAVIVSSALYSSDEPDLIVAGITSKVLTATGKLDYVLKDWAAAGLKFPSAFKPVLFTLEPTLILHHIGALSVDDMQEIDNRMRLMLDL